MGKGRAIIRYRHRGTWGQAGTGGTREGYRHAWGYIIQKYRRKGTCYRDTGSNKHRQVGQAKGRHVQVKGQEGRRKGRSRQGAHKKATEKSTWEGRFAKGVVGIQGRQAGGAYREGRQGSVGAHKHKGRMPHHQTVVGVRQGQGGRMGYRQGAGEGIYTKNSSRHKGEECSCM